MVEYLDLYSDGGKDTLDCDFLISLCWLLLLTYYYY